jgi:hypothetical protein
MIKDIYRKYFQKSYNFLYPLLGIKKSYKIKPKQTYIVWDGVYDKTARKLICVYKRDINEKWLQFEKEQLIPHKMLESSFTIDDKTIIYIFNFNIYKDDFDNFIKGKYSQLTTYAKQVLGDYYGIHTPEWVFIESYLFPEVYYDKYAEILGVDVELLKGVGELCECYNEEKETCVLKHSQIHTV